MKIEMLDFDDLNDTEKLGASNNGCGKEYANYIRITHNGETILIENDAMEPEDARLTRDLEWVGWALQRCYEIGVEEGAKSGAEGGNHG